MSGIAILIWIVVILILLGGGIALLIYGLHKHEDKNEKTSTHKIMAFVGGVLILISIIVFIFFIIKYRKDNKLATVIEPKTQDTAMSQMEMSQMSQGIQGGRYLQDRGMYSQGGMYSEDRGMMYQGGGMYSEDDYQNRSHQPWRGQDSPRWSVSGPETWNAPREYQF